MHLNRATEVPSELSAPSESPQKKGSEPTESGELYVLKNSTGACVPQLVEQRAAISPEALALSCGPQRITYAELDRRSNQLAHYLRGLGVLPGSIVGVCLERSVDFPVAALAVWKAGCSYVPLEAKAPVERLRFMLENAQVSVVLTNSGLLESLTGGTRQLVALDRFAGEISRCPSETLPPLATLKDPAYVIFTSGSTGAPKAVQVGHGSLLNLVEWHNRAFEVTPEDRATQVASIGFDAAVWELWPYLVAGASVHTVEDETRMQAEKLRDWVVREKITISFVPTPIAEQMVKLKWPTGTRLRFLLTGADVLHQHPPANLPFTLVNNYGPTECTVVATSIRLDANKATGGRPPIGEPIDNVQVYILDGEMRQVAPGQIGEIFIGGKCLALGYLHDPAMTAERFVRNPFSVGNGARLYRTGDLGRFAEDGSIEFDGRVDDQVKIRGYRIELNEVVSAILRHPEIRESTVVAGDDHDGVLRLVAYIVPRDARPTGGELRNFLGNILPDYMIPAAFVVLERLPIGSSGKVDRALLPAVCDENMLRDDTQVGPRTPTEQRIAGIVGSLLGLESVGVNDNFFFLGGNSLFGTQVIARVREAFHVEVSLLALFDHPTVAATAAEVERLMVAKLDSMSEEEVQRLLDSNPEPVDL
jgi:amino acid adenylation domain-containing protein